MADTKTTHLELTKQDLNAPPDGAKDHVNWDTLDSEVWARGKTFNGEAVGSDGGFHVSTIPLADNLTTSAGQKSEGTYLIRTTGGDASIADNGDAWLTQINGAYVHTGYSAPVVDMQVYPASRTSEEEDLEASIDEDVFMAYVQTAGTTTLTYSSNGWSADPADYGITIVSGVPKAGDVITVTYTLEVPGTITMSYPKKFISTGWNLYDHSKGYAHLINYSNEPGYVFMIDGDYTTLEFATTVTGSRSPISPVNNAFSIGTDGYLFVTGGSDSGDTPTKVWMTWSDWNTVEKANKGVYEAYEEYTIDLETFMATNFPYGLMSVGEVYDEINLNSGYATSRVVRQANNTENMAAAKSGTKPFIYDANYIYIERDPYVTIEVQIPDQSNPGQYIRIYGDYTANDHGMEMYTYSTVPMLTQTVYGSNLKNKLERDVLTISYQDLNSDQQSQVRTNIGAPSLSDVGFFLMSNSLTYVKLDKNVSINSSYTVPVDGFYNLRCVGTGGGMASWYIDSARTMPIMSNANSYAISQTLAFKAGTVIYTRDYSSTAYRVNGYYPINLPE